MNGAPDGPDVLVVGGGPVGLACAIEARLAGLSVVVVEPREAPVDKACGEGLMPGALRAVQRLGVDPPGHDLAGISYRAGALVADHRFAGGPGRGVRRTTLHAALAGRAAELGAATVAGRVEALTLRADGAGVTLRADGERSGAHQVHAHQIYAHQIHAHQIHARHVLACDGLHSTVRRLLDLEVPPRARGRRFGLRRHFRVAPWTDLVEVHWGARVEAYVTPVAPDVVGVALLGPRGTAFDDELAALPGLAAHLRGAEPLGPVRGAGPLRQDTRRRALGPVRLVGDASGYVDALTGEGLRVGLAQARAVVGHLEDPAGYERAWSRATRDYRVLTSALVRAATSPARGAIVPLARAVPPLYGAVVERLAR
ncbi:NAD(P)/FAD-dependent oxidoreductase [Cellulomonas sp. PhB143]|uniref:NAD(P)/FAD-dependent oxidoreductase n=1 Tax=Cellulomonas sp. PhB143 TaxID=2485186 RepID=UPI000F9CEF02|nr:FAD-dependent monooxygenase [Cellulomonas sp. PhB143]ROS75305.1 flavin-dependent dehydrogenase [Cellulomonas sp. PhB143]